jgi:hypothetical protein
MEGFLANYTVRKQNRPFCDLAAYFAFYGLATTRLTKQGELECLSGVPLLAEFF